MVNLGGGAAFILGILLAVAGAGLFFLRSIRPELARDYDIFFAAVGLLCGIILMFNGWRLDPILQFGQFMLTGTAVFFAFESIRLRGAATEQARRNTPTVDRDRPVSRTRVYTEAEFDKIDPYDNSYEGAKPNYNSPRLRGYDDPQPRPSRRPAERRRPTPETEIRDEPRRSRSRNRPESSDYGDDRFSKDDRYSYGDRDSRPRRRPSSPPPSDSYDDWSAKDEWDDSPRRPSRPRPRPTREETFSEPTPSPTARRRPNPVDLGRSYDDPEGQDNYDSQNSGRDYDSDLGRDYDNNLGRSYDDEDDSIPGDYVVDYQPLDGAGSDYSDDTGQDDYDDYDDAEDSTDDYDNYSDRPERRKPINFNDYD